MTLRMASHLKADLMTPLLDGQAISADDLLARVDVFSRHLERMLGLALELGGASFSEE